MRTASLAGVLALVLAAGCAARAAAPVAEIEIPALQPPPAPPRIIATYVEPAPPPVPAAEPVEPAVVVKPQPRPAPPPPAAEPEARDTPPPAPPPSLTLTPIAGAEAKTEASIRALLDRASKELARVNMGTLSADGRTQLETARRFAMQAEEALKSRNLVLAGKLADKAVTMAAVLVR
jgi:hypothetical protein